MRQKNKIVTAGATVLSAMVLVFSGSPLAAQNAAGNAATGNAAGAPGNGGMAAGNNGANGNGTATGGMNGVGGNNGVNGVAGTATNGNAGASGQAGMPGGSVPVHGSPAPQHYDLTRTIADAIKASTDVQTATRTVQIDQKRADNQAAQGRPHANAQASGTEFDQATKVPFALPGLPPTALTVVGQHTETLSLNLSDQVDIGGEIRAAQDQYQLQSLADQFVLDQARNARILRAQTIYFDLLQTMHQVQVAQANLADENQNLTEAQKQNAAGTGLKLDLLRAQTQVAQAQQQFNQAQNNYEVAESAFNDLVGRPLDTPITVDDVPGVTVGVPVTNTGAVGAPTDQTLFPPPDVSNIDIKQSQQTALTHRPEILQAQVNVRVAGLGIKLARAGMEPTLRFDATGAYYPDTSFETPRQRTAQVTGTLTIPLYDSNATHDLVQAAHLQQDNTQSLLDSEKSDVALDVSQTYLNLVTAAQNITAANSALQSAVAAQQNAEIRYQGGVGLFLEVTDAQAALVQAQNSQINAVYDYLIARAQFENAMGTPVAA